MDILIDFVNFLISELGNLGQALVRLLPSSPLQWTAVVDSEILSWVNWLIPIGEMVVIGEMWLIAILGWYIIRPILKWIKIAGG